MNKRLIAGLVVFILVMGLVLWVLGIIPTVYHPWHGGCGTSLNDPRWKIIDARDKWDRSWQGKMPIELYGKVVDENEQPVAGAKIELSLTDFISCRKHSEDDNVRREWAFLHCRC